MRFSIIVLIVSCGILLGVATLPDESARVSNGKTWTPIYDQSIDPDAKPDSIWLLVNPRSIDCAIMVEMVNAGDLAPEAVYDPLAACVRLGYVK